MADIFELARHFSGTFIFAGIFICYGFVLGAGAVGLKRIAN